MQATDNFRKHTAKNPLQRFFIDNFFRTLIAEARLLDPETVLDAGCGEGFTLSKFRNEKIGKELTGIDFLDRAIKIGKELHPDLNLKTGSIYEMPFKDKSFDLVLCTEVLEHLEYPEKALAELERVTKKNCLISVPNEPLFMAANFLRGKNLSRFGNDIEHIQHWSKRGIAKLIGKYFEVIEVRNPFPWTLVAASKSL
jgi:ubiquinone/menaquinone biosynthesis C-methylase UbiE